MMDICHHIHVLQGSGRPNSGSGLCRVHIYLMIHFIALDMIFLIQLFVYIHTHMIDERCSHIGSVHTGSRHNTK